MNSPLERQLAANAKQFELLGRAAPAGRNAPQIARNEIVLPFIDPDQLGEMIRSIVWEELEAVAGHLKSDLGLRPPSADESNSAGTLMTNGDVMEYLKVSARTLRRMELQEQIPPARWVGNSKRWRRQELEEWIGGQDGGRK